jgi:hypothetical protein
MSLLVYKTMHLFGIALILIALGGVATHAAGGGSKTSNPLGRALGIAHGLGLVLSLVGGFGMMARLGLSFSEGWLWVKIVIWLFFGAATAVAYRNQGLARSLPVVGAVIVGLAAYLALYKPF